MVSNKRPVAVVCADLDVMRSGTLDLSVPLVDDVIQIGIGGDPHVGTIRVTKTPTVLRVCRVDGRSIQAQLLEYPRSDAGPVIRRTVFDAPVSHLELERVESGPWLSTARIRVERHLDVGQFIRTIATFGVAKQGRLDGVPLR